MLAPPRVFKVNVEEVKDVLSIAFEKVIDTVELTDTPVASAVGEVELTVGAVLSDVTKLQVTGVPSWTKLVSLTVAAIVAI
jgi:hypothetical protein